MDQNALTDISEIWNQDSLGDDTSFELKQQHTKFAHLCFQNERLQILNAELSEKAEASELQINTISQQYRTVLQEKQVSSI